MLSKLYRESENTRLQGVNGAEDKNWHGQNILCTYYIEYLSCGKYVEFYAHIIKKKAFTMFSSTYKYKISYV